MSHFISTVYLITFKLFSLQVKESLPIHSAVRVPVCVCVCVSTVRLHRERNYFNRLFIARCPPSEPSPTGVRVVIFFFISSSRSWRFLGRTPPLCFHLRLHSGKSIPHYTSKWNEPITFLAFFSVPPSLDLEFSLCSPTPSPLMRRVASLLSDPSQVCFSRAEKVDEFSRHAWRVSNTLWQTLETSRHLNHCPHDWFAHWFTEGWWCAPTAAHRSQGTPWHHFPVVV